MSFRDENAALRAKVTALEEEVERLEGELTKRDASPPRQPETPVVPGLHDADSIAGLVAAREASHRARRARRVAEAERARRRRVARLAKRPRRVHVERAGERLRVVIAKKLLGDKILEQLGWGYAFAFVNPGAFVVLGVGFAVTLGTPLSAAVAFPLAILAWAVLLAGINLLWAFIARSRYTLEVTERGDFVLYGRRPSRPLLLGHRPALRVRVDEPDPAALGCAHFGDGRAEVTVDRLTADDLQALASGLPERCLR